MYTTVTQKNHASQDLSNWRYLSLSRCI